jgi:hypothetical protein
MMLKPVLSRSKPALSNVEMGGTRVLKNHKAQKTYKTRISSRFAAKPNTANTDLKRFILEGE